MCCCCHNHGHSHHRVIILSLSCHSCSCSCSSGCSRGSGYVVILCGSSSGSHCCCCSQGEEKKRGELTFCRVVGSAGTCCRGCLSPPLLWTTTLAGPSWAGAGATLGVTVRPQCRLNSYSGSVADHYGLLPSSRLKRLSQVVTGSVTCKKSHEVTGSITCCVT
jgi:hypothetical protein